MRPLAACLAAALLACADAPRGPSPHGLHAPCPDAGCPAGQTCLEYCGVAGCRPETTFRTCEIPCRGDAECPAGHACVTIADGPGRVCARDG